MDGRHYFSISFISILRYSLEVSSGFGRTEDVIFRIGLLNSNATYHKVDFVLRAICDGLRGIANYIPPTSTVYY